MLMSHRSKKIVTFLISFSVVSGLHCQDVLSDWVIPQTISSGTVGNIPRVAIDANGNAAAVWIMGGFGIQGATFNKNTSWINLQTFSTLIDYISYDVIAYAGTAMVAWAVNDPFIPTNNGVFAVQYNGSNWSTVTTVTNAASTRITMCVDSSGNVTICWRDSIGLKATRYEAGTSWNVWAPVIKVITTVNPVNILDYKVLTDSFGDDFFVWQDTNNLFNGSLSATFYKATETSWGDWSPYVNDIVTSSTLQRLKADGNEKGSFVVGWSEESYSVDGVIMDVKATRYNRGDDWTSWAPSIKTMPKDPSSSPNVSWLDYIAIDNNMGPTEGNVFISWSESPSKVRATRCEGTWPEWDPMGTPKTLAADATLSDNGQTMDSSGNVFLAWVSTVTPKELQIIRYDQIEWSSWSPAGLEQDIQIFSGGEQPLYVSIGTDSSGNASLSWLRHINSLVRASVYSVTQNSWRPLRDLSGRLSDDIIPVPAMAMSATGETVVIWNSSAPTAPSFFNVQSAWTVNLADMQWTNYLPDNGARISAASDGVGNMFLGVTEAGQASLWENSALDPINVWTSNTISLHGQYVTGVSLDINEFGNSAYGYNVDDSESGSLFVAIDNNSPELVSADTHDAQDINTAQAYYGEAAVAYVDNQVTSIFRSNGSGYEGDIYVSLYNPSTTSWVSTLVSEATGNSASPQVAMDGASNVFVVWEELDGSNSKIQANYLTFSNGSWSLNGVKDLSELDADLPQLAADTTGNAIFIWRLVDEEVGEIQATRYPQNVDWGSWTVGLTTVDLSVNGENATNPVIDIDSAGNGIVAWIVQDESDLWRVQSARFDIQTNEWALPPTTTRSPTSRYLSGEGKNASLPSISLGYQGYGLVSYIETAPLNSDSQVMINAYDPDLKQFLSSIESGLPVGNVEELATLVNYNNHLGVAVGYGGVTIRDITRANGDEGLIGVDFFKYESTLRPAAPVNLQGQQELHRFATQGDLINVLRWKAGNETTTYFEIYSDASKTQLIATIPAKYPLVFYHHCRKPGVATTYYLFAVNSAGVYSDFTKIMVP